MGIRDLLVNGPLGFGTAPLGNMFRDIPDDEAEATVDAAWDHGTRFFVSDRTPITCRPKRPGASPSGRQPDRSPRQCLPGERDGGPVDIGEHPGRLRATAATTRRCCGD